MPRLDRRFSVPLAVLAALALAACGGDSPFPVAPTSFAAQSAANAQGVTLSGTVLGLGTASSASFGVSALSTSSDPDAITVSVDGMDTSVPVGDDGTFTLRGLPEGGFTLVFTDAAGVVIGELDFSGVLPNQEITITVDVSSGTVLLVDERRNGISHGDIEIQSLIGEILSVNPLEDSRFVIDGYTVVARASVTAIRAGNEAVSVDELTVGDQVHVKGVWLDPVGNDPQEVLAHEIMLQRDDDDDGDDSEEKITICHKGKNTLSISPSAWPAHQAHGDTLGACG